MGTAAAISVENLRKRYGDKAAVEGLTFDVPWGAVTGFLGPNGAGKSTTLRMVLGLTTPDAGTALIGARRYVELEQPLRAVGALLETQQFHPGRSARDHLALLAVAGDIPHPRVDEVLADVQLAGDARRKVGHFSLGMRQRLGLAAALLGEPPVLVLDEPANGLDPAGIRWLRDRLRRFADAGGAVLVSSHNLPEVAHLADEVVVIERGRLVSHTAVEALTARQGTLVRTPDVDRFHAVLAADGFAVQALGGRDLRVAGPAEEVGAAAARAGVVLHALQPEEVSLEQAFFDLTGAREEGAR